MTQDRLDLEHLDGVLARSEQLHSPSQVERALDRLAVEISAVLADKNPLVLCVMTGGVIPAGRLLPRLDFPLRLDYVHATRYRERTRGGEMHWLRRPAEAVRDRYVLVIDDIYDEGLTLEAIVDDCRAQGAQAVYSGVLVEKLRSRECAYRPDFIGLQVADRYVFGCGMDYRGYLRNFPGIAAVSDQDL